MAVDSSPSCVLTFDVGGSHVSSGLCSLATLEVHDKTSVPLDVSASFEGFVDLLGGLGEKVAGTSARPVGASLAVPGPFDTASGISLMQHKLHALYGKDLRGALASRFGLDPDRLRFLNDAAAFLLGEVNAGAARGSARAVGLALGTGIGSAFAQDGHCLMGGEAVPPGGEIWNLPYRSGIVEDLISTRALKDEYRRRTGRDLEVKEIAEAAASDADAREVFARFGAQLGEVIRDIAAPFHPEVVVIGGGISRAGKLFLPMAQEQLHGLELRIVPAELLDEAALVGAAAFWRDECLRTDALAAQGAGA